MLHRIREAMRTMAEDDAVSGPVEVSYASLSLCSRNHAEL